MSNLKEIKTVTNNNLSLSISINPDDYFASGETGTEFVINRVNGDAFISTNGVARLLKTSDTTVRSYCEKLEIKRIDIQVCTVQGLRMAKCLTSKDFRKLTQVLNPELAEEMAEGGTKLFLYGHAGYQLNLTPPDSTPQLTPAQLILAQAPYVQLAADNPGIAQLAIGINTIPCLIISEKPFTLRFWTQIHFPGYDLSRQALTRFGRQVAATYQQHKLELPTNGYTPTTNKYTRADHDLICQVFQTMLDQGQLES